MTDTEWIWKKAQLPTTQQKCIIARQYKPDNGGLCFRVFPNSSALIVFCNNTKNSKPHLYEVITDKVPVYLYIDLDLVPPLPHTYEACDEYTHKVHATFMRVFCAFIPYVQWIPGTNMQVANTSYTNKVSLHYKFNLILPNVVAAKDLVASLVAFVTHSPDQEAYNMLSFLKPNLNNSSNPHRILAIDLQVYRTFGCMRALYSSKYRMNHPHAPMLPYADSSHHVADHLIVVHADNMQPNCVTLADIGSIHVPHMSARQRNQRAQATALQPLSDTKTCEFIPDIPKNTLSIVASIIKQSPLIRSKFQTDVPLDFICCKYVTPHVYDFGINTQTTPIYCPYGCRVHRNNRGWFRYDHDTKVLSYKCFDDSPECSKPIKPITYSVLDTQLELVLQDDIYNMHTLHDRYGVIEWDSEYHSATMHDYPIAPLVAVRANMGVGKTEKVMSDLISKYCVNTEVKCMFITYQRLLSRKFLRSLESYGFENYLDIDTRGEIHTNKLIICLDSLHRVKTSNFDFIIVDEALSVMLHFQSPLIRNIGYICLLYEHLLLQARYVYFIDACVDNMMVYNTLNYLQNKKNTTTHYIRNSYVRPTNRKANVIHCDTNGDARINLKGAAITQVVALLNQGKRVVVSSSTKRFTDALSKVIEKDVPAARIIVYNSETDQALLFEHAENLNATWTQYDAVIYSPTIGAGLSFTEAHFHALVAYAENSYHAPSVDLVIQQLYRVRNLIDGDMTIYINDIVRVETPQQTEAEVITWLDDQCISMHEYCANINMNQELITYCAELGPNGLKYAKNKLSYTILKGLVFNRHKSFARFKDILVTSLREDYGIPVTLTPFEVSPDLETHMLKLKDIMDQEISKPIPFSIDILPTTERANDLLAKSCNYKTPLSDKEKQELWTYNCVSELWCIPRKFFDEQFYNEFVGPCNRKGKNDTLEMFYNVQRLRDLLTKDREEMERSYTRAIANVVSQDDYNLPLHRTRKPEYYAKLLEAERLCSILFATDTSENHDYQTTLKMRLGVKVKAIEYKQRIAKYLSQLTDAHYRKLKKHYGLRYKTLAEFLGGECDNTRRVSSFIVKVLMGVSLCMTEDSKTKNKTRPSYGDKKIDVDNMVVALQNTYRYRLFESTQQVENLTIDDFIDP
jgi:hypothetical protein